MIHSMELLQKLEAVAADMAVESAEEVSPVGRSVPAAPCGNSGLGIFHAQMGHGKTLPMLKTMLTTACERNCGYCPFRAGRNMRRVRFTPEELAGSFMKLVDAGRAEGIFLSSGIIRGSVTTQDQLLDTVDILRTRHQFRGYIHLKLMPGVEQAQVAQAARLADRLSVNLEAPTVDRLRFLAPMKQLVEELFRPLREVEALRREQPARNGWGGRWPSTATQFVVGAAGDTDLELLTATDWLYRRVGLKRAYFSAFTPIADTPLENLPPENRLREHRLYQASFLLRDYGFGVEELPFAGEGRLPLEEDPKRAWARHHLAHAPVELNRADRVQLLRVPGIGPVSADRIIAARRQGRLRDLAQIRQLGVPVAPLREFVLLDGVRPAFQMSLF
jgi:predicted DNA-binding helix-hairpin-helix protein